MEKIFGPKMMEKIFLARTLSSCLSVCLAICLNLIILKRGDYFPRVFSQSLLVLHHLSPFSCISMTSRVLWILQKILFISGQGKEEERKGWDPRNLIGESDYGIRRFVFAVLVVCVDIDSLYIAR